MNEKLVYSVPEVAEVLGICQGLVWELIHENKLPAIRLGKKRVLIPKAQLEQFLDLQSIVIA